jgi:hypothetical protein
MLSQVLLMRAHDVPYGHLQLQPRHVLVPHRLVHYPTTVGTETLVDSQINFDRVLFSVDPYGCVQSHCEQQVADME